MVEARGRFPWVLTVLVATCLVVLVSLGVWQVQRLVWKQGLIADAEAASTRPPAPLAEVLGDGDIEFRRVFADCPGLASAPYVSLRTIQDGEPGVRLISACPLNGTTWLVDRGFVSEIISTRPPVSPDATPMRIEAVARTAPRGGAMTPAPEGDMFYGRDQAAMARALGVVGPVAGQTLYATTSTNPGWLALKPSAPPVAFSNNHLGYALTWFGLALALAAVYAAMLRRRPKS